MMTPTSTPVVPVQPNAAAYGIAALNLFQVFNRTSYLAQFGVQAPAYNPALPLKGWFDTMAVSGNATYNCISGSNPPLFGSFTIPASEASAINLPGDYNYPVYAPTPTTVATQTFAGTTQGIGTANLCQYADAVTLAQVIGGPNALAPTEPTYPGTMNWGSETRRMWCVMVAGQSLMAAPLLAQMWANGIGAPGSWDLSTPSAPKWTPTPDPDWSTLPVCPTPVRALLPNEQLQAGPLGIGVEVVRTDMQPSGGGAGATGSGGGLTAQQAAQLQAVFNWVMKQS